MDILRPFPEQTLAPKLKTVFTSYENLTIFLAIHSFPLGLLISNRTLNNLVPAVLGRWWFGPLLQLLSGRKPFLFGCQVFCTRMHHANGRIDLTFLTFMPCTFQAASNSLLKICSPDHL